MLMQASRAAARLTKQAWSLPGAAWKGTKAIAQKGWQHRGKVLGAGLTVGLTGMAVNEGLKKSKAGLTPGYAQATQYRGVPAIPEV